MRVRVGYCRICTYQLYKTTKLTTEKNINRFATVNVYRHMLLRPQTDFAKNYTAVRRLSNVSEAYRDSTQEST